MKKDLKYFMRPEAKEEQIVTVVGPDSIRDENGNVVLLEIKRLHADSIEEINNMYRTKEPLKDKKGNYIVQNGKVVFREERDNVKAGKHIMVEALVYPNLRDPELMAFFNCVDITQMPGKVFPNNEEYGYVNRKVMEVLGLIEAEDEAGNEVEKEKTDLEEAKN